MNNLEKKYKTKENDPLGVLLKLLDKNHLEISNFSLAQVADQYLDYLNKTKNQSEILENISEFIWVASRLALLKSKILLASVEIEEVSTEEEGDLKDRLIEYKKFKKISDEVKVCFESSKKLFVRKNKEIFDKKLEIKFNKKDLERIFEGLAKVFNLENECLYQKKDIKETLKIEEKIEQIKNILNKVRRVKFSKIILNNTNRLESVVSFLAILELVKQGTVLIKQEKSFQDIEIFY